MSIANIGKKISGKTKELSQKAKIMSETNSLNNIVKGEECKIEFQYKTIGKLYFEKFAENPDEDFVEAIETIKASMEKIEETKAEIIKIKSRFNCPNCGAPFKNDAAFCSKCGSKLPEIEEPQPAIPENAQKCDKCGNILKKEAIFCNACGNRLVEENISEETVLAENNETFAPAEVTEEVINVVDTTIVEKEKSEEVTDITDTIIVEKTEEETITDSNVTETVNDVEKTNTDSKICPNCGNKMYDEDIFCNECGTKVG